MPKTKITAGAELDMINREEMRSLLREFHVDALVGARPILISASGTSDATGVVAMGGSATLTGGRLGPDVGFFWAVSRLAMRVDLEPAAYTVYMNHASSQQVIRDVNADCNGYTEFGAFSVILVGGSSLVLRASSATPNSTASVSGAAIEAPIGLLWKWLAG